MLDRTRAFIAAGAIIGSLAITLHADDGLAGQNHRKTAMHPPRAPYAPYYYSRWDPHSLYSIYDHLSGGRQMCYLPTEPCENDHRVQN